MKRKILAQLMGNNSSGKTSLLDSAPFRAQLLHSAVPNSAATGTTATFTRATASTWKNNDGNQVTGLSGEIGFVGARRVRNLVSASENLTSWLGSGTVTATTMTLTAASQSRYNARSVTGTLGRTFVASATVSVATGTATIAMFTTNAIAYNTGNGTTITVTTTPTRVSLVSTMTGANNTTLNLGFGDVNYTSGASISATTGVAITITNIQLEDVTAQTTQTAGEYVSVGVTSAPYYHGSMVDGVKCFATDINGSPIPSSTLLGYQAEGARTNLCLQSNAFTTTWTNNAVLTVTQDAIGPDGATSAWTLTQTAGSLRFLTQTIGALTAANYTLSFFVKKTTGAQSTYPVFNLYAAVPAKICGVTVDTTNGVATVWTSWTGLTVVTSSATCVSHNANYWRVSLTGLLTTDSWRVTLLPAGATSATQATGEPLNTTAGSAVFYGAQVELGSFASSYIATTTIAVARNADVESVSTSSNIAAAAGSVYLEYTPAHTPSGTISLWGTYVDASNYTAILHDATNLIFRKRIAGVNYDATIANAFVSGTTYKACATWGTAGTSITLNGTEGTPHANTTAAQIAATMQLGADGNSLQQPFAPIRNCRNWLRQLSASERAAVTA